MLNAVPKQFRLNDEGLVLYQIDPTNPMPGEPIACIAKGVAPLEPEIRILDTLNLESQDRDFVTARLGEWLKGHIATVLETLVALKDEGGDTPSPVRDISLRLYEAMGIVPRAGLENLIAALDSDMRRTLRQKQIKLGPILVFMPALNKPAAVRLRALLWSLWNDKPLPARIPADGMVSKSLADQADINHDFYRAIGYPVYANRAIRVDMLDRVISAIYDNAKDGTFKATHAMAEWLGCSIPDLYAVIEAMGHKKVSDPAEQKVEQSVAEAGQETITPTPEIIAVPEVAAPEAPAAEAAPAVAHKPELATFRLRKGKAYGESGERKSRPENREFRSKDKPRFEDRKKPGNERPRKQKRDDKKPERFKEREDRGPRIISAAAEKQGDSPFAVLQNLKLKQGGQ